MTEASDSRLERLRLDVGEFTFDALAAGPPDGALVLLLHGWPEFATSWSEIALDLGAAGYRAVAVDQRGYSAHARPENVEAYALRGLVSDALGFADALGREHFHIASHDWGAIVGWAVAARHPERVLTFTSFAIPHPLAFAVARRTDPEQQKKSAYIDFFRLPDHVAEKTLLGNGAAKLRAVYQEKMPAALIADNVARLSEPGVLTASLNWYRAMNGDFEIGTVSVPTLYAWGSDDLALGATAARACAAYVSGPYRFEVLEGVSHWILGEVPGRAAALLREHLGS